MRTTVEIPDAQRARLLELAARRGEKGFSGIVQEALARYLADEDDLEEARRDALAVIGTLSERSAAQLEDATRRARERWR